jgi:hypothetical protein
VHSSYKDEALGKLKEAKLEPLQFDPTSGNSLKDPRLTSLQPSERDAKAKELHQKRLLRTLHSMRNTVHRAVARAWFSDQTLTEESYYTFLQGINKYLQRHPDEPEQTQDQGAPMTMDSSDIEALPSAIPEEMSPSDTLMDNE